MNHMEEVAAMYGKKLGDKFYVMDTKGKMMERWSVWFNEDGLDSEIGKVNGTLRQLLTGEAIIAPYIPKEGETYYSIGINNVIRNDIWCNDLIDFTYYAAGNCFQTEEDAKAHKEELTTRLTKFYNEGRVIE